MQKAFVNLMRGDPAPRFTAATESNPLYIFDTVAGRYVVLCFSSRAARRAARRRSRQWPRTDTGSTTSACACSV